MINLIAGFFCSFFLHAFLFSFFFNINFNDYSEEKIIQLPVNLIFQEKIEPKPKKTTSKNVKTTSSSSSEDAKSKNDFESEIILLKNQTLVSLWNLCTRISKIVCVTFTTIIFWSNWVSFIKSSFC